MITERSGLCAGEKMKVKELDDEWRQEDTAVVLQTLLIRTDRRHTYGKRRKDDKKRKRRFPAKGQNYIMVTADGPQ